MKNRLRNSFCLLLGLLGFKSLPAFAAQEIFLCADELQGEAQNLAYLNCIDVLAWSWGMSNSGSTHIGGVGGEGFVALIALVTVMTVAPEAIKGMKPGTVYGNGIGRFMTILIGEQNLRFAITFGAMAFSTFVFDTLDVCTRLGRYIVQELFGWQDRKGAAAATALTMTLPVYFILFGGEGSWIKFWTLFGASNQLLAALTLVSMTVWLRRTGKRWLFAALPAVFVLAITVWALGILLVGQARASSGLDVAAVNAASSFALLGLAGFVVAVGVRSMREGSSAPW